MEYLNNIIKWIQNQVKQANANGVILGISGGIDSALVAYLAKHSFSSNSLGLIIQINKNEVDLKDSIDLTNFLKLNYKIIDLEKEYNELLDKLNLKNQLAKDNLQARLRMNVLYAFAQENNYLVLGTDNYNEYNLGYFTKWGDGACDLLPIVNMYKSQVYEYCKKIGIPKNIINKKPSAGFRNNQYDEDELGFTYNDFELYDKKILNDISIKNKIENQINKTEHKRKEIPKGPRKD